jgi:hypothetical protein
MAVLPTRLKETSMSARIPRSLMLNALAASLLGACASAPPVNSLATVAVQATVTLADLQATHSQAIRVRAALQRAGIGSDVVSAGRVVRVACATMSDGTWGGLGVLPEGTRAANDSVWRIRVLDVGDNDREAVNAITDPLPALTWSGKSAYTFVPNWRELGRFSNLDPVPLPADQASRYLVVFSRYLVRCSA